ncbi:ruBisCO-associated protein-like [Gastrolobium bilobum]|uniref:ruBisCO-associated protein-like n=1 Tax=Gastrolobium bilobum TaxID=150636 RepID=UPI002AAF2FDC|nr:ruBisCO-associated protein-like [Gastrolobium bilobum]
MSSIFRQYTFDDSFEQVFVSSKFLKEYQISLTFARDYDENGVTTNGVFRPTWDMTKVTPSAITQFKKENPDVNVKVYISIGNRGTQFPFSPKANESWISNATHSLTTIIKNNDYDLQVDGIDILYESIEASPNDFAECVGKLIKNLKEAEVIREASISPSFALNKEYYFCLYSTYFILIDWVDYQFQNEVTPVFAPNTLVERYKELVFEFYPRRKLFAGYSAENEDWATLSPIVFFLGGMDILKKRRGPGISIHYHNYYTETPHIYNE